MKKINTEIRDNLFEFSDKEIAIIHALCVFSPDDMTAEADAIRQKMQVKLSFNPAVSKFKVWN